MAWGFWSASTISDRGRSPRRITTTASTMYYQSQQPQYTIAINKQEEKSNCNTSMLSLQQPNQTPKQSAMNSRCATPCQSTCHSPTCNSPSCSATTGIENLFYFIFSVLRSMVEIWSILKI